MKLYLDEFTERMKKTCPNVTVHIDSPAVRRARKANVGVARANGRISEPTTKNDWMICMRVSKVADERRKQPQD